MSKSIKLICMYIMFVLLGVNIVFAAENQSGDMGFEYIEFDGQQVPVGKEISIDDATKYVEEKGYVLVGAIQKIAKPITLVVMVGCGLMAVVSGLGGNAKGGGSGGWMWAAVVSAICYTAVVFSPMILQIIVNFMKP